MRTLAVIFSAVFFVFGFSLGPEERSVTGEDNLSDVLIALGDPKPSHYRESFDPEKVRMGREMVHNGRARKPKGGFSRYISAIYVCTDCHNQVQEDPIISAPDPASRLDYAIKNDLPFLQATTFWGMVNRRSFYNDDYKKKYGSLVDAARNSVEESTQLCAKECSSGRHLEDWELECIIQYYWTLQLEISDLKLNADELAMVNEAIETDSDRDDREAVLFLGEKYMTKSSAHFAEVPWDLSAWGSKSKGDAANGKEIFNRGCQSCHREQGPSLLVLEDAKLTMKKFQRHLQDHSPYNLLEITRKGTYAEPGHRQYMPMYSLERMSESQLEDLRAYIESW